MELNNIPDNAVVLKGDHPVTTSLRVAEIFGKQHKDVLKRIDALIAECPPEFSRRNFAPAEYIDAQGKPRPMYDLARNGFALLAMGSPAPRHWPSSWPTSSALTRWKRR